MSQRAIGIIDSGVGGLTVVKEIMRQIPQESIIYYGDTKHCPYGVRPLSEVRDFTFQIIDFLIAKGVKMVVIACNTATAASLEAAKKHYDIPIIGVIQPGVRAAISASQNNRIGVIGTNATIKSEIYQETLRTIKPNLFVTAKACQQFVDIVEQNLVYTREARRHIAECLLPMREEGIDTLIMGCTHYPIMANAISMILGSEVELISSAAETARETIALLDEKGLLSKGQAQHEFYVSGDDRSFNEIGSRWLGYKVKAQVLAYD